MANMIVNSSNGLGADAVHGGSMVDARHPSGNHHGLGLLALAGCGNADKANDAPAHSCSARPNS